MKGLILQEEVKKKDGCCVNKILTLHGAIPLNEIPVAVPQFKEIPFTVPIRWILFFIFIIGFVPHSFSEQPASSSVSKGKKSGTKRSTTPDTQRSTTPDTQRSATPDTQLLDVSHEQNQKAVEKKTINSAELDQSKPPLKVQHKSQGGKQWLFEMTAHSMNTQQNYNNSGVVVKSLAEGNSYALQKYMFFTRYEIQEFRSSGLNKSKFGVFVNFEFAQAQSKDISYWRKSQGFTHSTFGADYLIYQSMVMDLISGLFYKYPFYSQNASSDEVTISEGAQEIGLFFKNQFHLGTLQPEFHLGYTYRDSNRSALIPYSVQLEFTWGSASLGGGFSGYQTVGSDKFMNDIERTDLQNRVNAGSQFFYSKNSSLLEALVWFRYRMSSIYQFTFGTSSSVNGVNAPKTQNFFGGVNFSFDLEPQSVRVENIKANVIDEGAGQQTEGVTQQGEGAKQQGEGAKQQGVGAKQQGVGAKQQGVGAASGTIGSNAKSRGLPNKIKDVSKEGKSSRRGTLELNPQFKPAPQKVFTPPEKTLDEDSVAKEAVAKNLSIKDSKEKTFKKSSLSDSKSRLENKGQALQTIEAPKFSKQAPPLKQDPPLKQATPLKQDPPLKQATPQIKNQTTPQILTIPIKDEPKNSLIIPLDDFEPKQKYQKKKPVGILSKKQEKDHTFHGVDKKKVQRKSVQNKKEHKIEETVIEKKELGFKSLNTSYDTIKKDVSDYRPHRNHTQHSSLLRSRKESVKPVLPGEDDPSKQSESSGESSGLQIQLKRDNKRSK